MTIAAIAKIEIGVKPISHLLLNAKRLGLTDDSF